ncbi:hypothetical protein, partial [Roseivivax isoporae]|uniref:hypothetical protein n=1 Tax=Roseivivax isoporae TaxID=591206 RepID=UPI0012EBCCF9
MEGQEVKTDLSNRTIGVMLFFGWMTWLLAEPMADIVDDYTTPQPWFHAELTVGEDVVHYTRVIERWMR